MPSDARPTPRSIPTNLRLLVLLEEITALDAPVTPADLYSRIDLPKPTLHRLFLTLEQEGFLQRTPDGRRYAPAPRLRRLAVKVTTAPEQRNEVLLVLQALSEQIGETCNYSMPERTGMKYLERAETRWPLRFNLPPVGSTVPFHCTASGKCYLASLPPARLRRLLELTPLERFTDRTVTDRDELEAQIEAARAQGFTIDNQEFMEGMIGLSVGVMVEGRLFGTLSFHAPCQRLDVATANSHVPQMRAAADQIARVLTG